MGTTELVPSISIANLVNQRAAVVERLTQAIELIRDAHGIALAAHVGLPRFVIQHATSNYRGSGELPITPRSYEPDTNGPRRGNDERELAGVRELMLKAIDSGGWQYLMSQSGLRSLMDATARAKWDKAILEGDTPELSEANIRSTFKMLHDSRGEMFERGVIACFKSLAWDYKTNLPQKFGKRIVVTYLNGSGGYHKGDELDDLLRVMHVLDGQPEPDHRHGVYALLRSASLCCYGAMAGVVENDYLHIRCFKNGNGHVTFKRPDLVVQMNLIIAKHYPGALPAPK